MYRLLSGVCNPPPPHTLRCNSILSIKYKVNKTLYISPAVHPIVPVELICLCIEKKNRHGNGFPASFAFKMINDRT